MSLPRRSLSRAAAYAVAAAVLLVMDTVWLVAVAGPLYRAELGDRIAAEPDLVAGGAFYVLYVAALVHFAVQPGLAAPRGGHRLAAVNGAFLGLTAYGTWALTNRAVLSDWPAALVPVDMAWGTGLSAVAAAATVAVVTRWLPPAAPAPG